MAEQHDSLSLLLIEDNPNDAMLVERYLGNAETPLLPDDIRIRHEETLTSGIEALDEEIDLLLLDLGLPESEGAETFDRVREETAGLPVIVLTGLEDDEAAVDLLKEGAQDYLTKSRIDESRLVKSIRYALERQEQKERLRATNEQLEILNRILRHDIRNDLQIQQLRAESLYEQLEEQARDIASIRDNLGKIVESNRHMVELTENSREYLEFVAGDTDGLTREPVRLDTLLEQELAKARSVHDDAEFSVDGSLSPTSVYANEMLASVFRNLLSNAVRHNDKAVPRIDISVEERHGVTRVTVADNGPGVPEEMREEIFGEGKLGLDSPGTGIGLYLVKTLVAAFQGRVWVKDNEPEGSRFTVELETAEAIGWVADG